MTGFSERAIGLLKGCHPAPAFAVTALLTVLAIAWGRGAAGSALVFATVLTGQLSIGWSNDLIDAGRDRAAGRQEKPVVAGTVSTRTLGIAAGVVLLLCVPFSFLNGLLAGIAHLVTVAAGWAYNLGLKSTVLSWLPYVVAFGLLPAVVTLGLPAPAWPLWWVMAAGALLGVGAHVANVVPDIEADLELGIRGWPQRLGTHARWVAPVPLAVAAVLLVVAPDGPVPLIAWLGFAGIAALLVVVAFVPGRYARGRAPFLLTLAIAALDVGLLVVRMP
ncbi:UbiA prenyltransferase family protein [Flindersiella endophytica]